MSVPKKRAFLAAEMFTIITLSLYLALPYVNLMDFFLCWVSLWAVILILLMADLWLFAHAVMGWYDISLFRILGMPERPWNKFW